jgi:hypothetical protein
MNSRIEYWLQISLNEADETSVTDLLMVSGATLKRNNASLNLVFVETEEIPTRDFISEMALLVKAQATKLMALGISENDLGILVLYQYDAQCSMEFSVHQLRLLSDAGLALSISCWQG